MIDSNSCPTSLSLSPHYIDDDPSRYNSTEPIASTSRSTYTMSPTSSALNANTNFIHQEYEGNISLNKGRK